MLAAQRHVSGHEESDHDLLERPRHLVEQQICALSGMRAGAQCPIRVHEWLPATFSPLPCSWHHDSDEGLITFWPEEYRIWAASRGLLDEHDRVDARIRRARFDDVARDDGKRVEGSRFAIASPPAGATYMVDPTLRMEFQTLPLRALGARGDVRWTVDGRGVGDTSGDEPVDWPLRRGEHVIAARDGKGQSAAVTITVK
jgi:membrane carboxypeptidase/penicillin-binding protein PbpC